MMRHGQRMHRNMVGIRQPDNVGQVIFALRVISVQRIQPAGQLRIGQHENPSVDFLHRFLFGRCVFFFHNRHHLVLRIADNAAVARRVGQDVGQQADFVAGMVEQLLQGGRVNQRHVAIQYQRAPRVGNVRQCRFQCVPRAQLLRLLHPADIFVRHLLHDQIFTVPHHHMNACRLQTLRRINHMFQHRFAADGMQHLGFVGIHARTFAGRKNNNV